MRTKLLSPKSGFTIIETVISLGIFAIVVTEITGVFLATMRVEEKSRAIRAVEQNARFISDFITREIRNGSINYSNPPGEYPSGAIPQPATSDLRFINVDSEHVRVYLDGETLKLVKYGVGPGGSDITGDLSGAEVKVSDAYFFINPPDDPLLPGNPKAQPRVTFTFTLTSNLSLRVTDQAKIQIQSSAVTREY